MVVMKISNSSWKKELSEKLKNPAQRVDQRIAIVGIGAELYGDDAIGILTARKLKPAFAQQEEVLVLEGGPLPESMTGPLRRFSPELVIFIDAADLGEPPGSITMVDPDRIGGTSFSTHSMPLTLLMKFLEDELNCEMLLIGVQPEQIEFGTTPSESGQKAVTRLARGILQQLLSTDIG